MVSISISSESTLLLVPTELELKLLAPQLGELSPRTTVEVCGFGPVSAAARAARTIETKRPSRVVLAGIAGTFCPDTLPVGAACCFRRVAIDGVGLGESDRFASAHDLGFSQVGQLEDVLPLESIESICQQDLLLTCCAASDSAGMASERRVRHPTAKAEDMEGFGVALACHLAEVPLVILRGISNVVGNRDKSTWEVEQALRATSELLREVLDEDSEIGTQS